VRSFFAMGKQHYDPEEGMKNWLHINNFGFYMNLTADVSVHRREGRRDYHLLYAADGEMDVGGAHLQSGDCCLFAPDEPQKYIYRARENCLYYWIHFTGARLEEILGSIALGPGVHTLGGRKKEADGLLRQISDVLIQGDTQNMPYALTLLLALLQLIALPPVRTYPLARAVRTLEDGGSDISIERLAQLHGMSTAHFIRSFRAAYGITPAAFRLQARMNQAKYLLSDTDMPVADTARQCGFADPLYFSRVFRRHTGISPSQYRKRLRIPDEDT